MDLRTLSERQMAQMGRKGNLPKSTTEVALHLVEEVGEVCEALREGKPKGELEAELADVLWQLNKLCWTEKVDLEKAFMEKLERNERR
ncbi:hypothetical protein JXB02_05225 [Candidatus Woesearchaeota archaeon]|nr:hypothetical protein [Candidatus Woesearchaeota archaeon]